MSAVQKPITAAELSSHYAAIRARLRKSPAPIKETLPMVRTLTPVHTVRYKKRKPQPSQAVALFKSLLTDIREGVGV